MATLQEQMTANALEAMKLTRKYFVIELDFSERSVKDLDGLVDQVEYALQGGRSDENIEQLTRVWGSYLGEVLRRLHGGQWVKQADGRTALSAETSTVYPHDCIRRRFEDATVSIWQYYQETRQQL